MTSTDYLPLAAAVFVVAAVFSFVFATLNAVDHDHHRITGHPPKH